MSVEVRVSKYVPETVSPEPAELRPVREVPARPGGRRTDFGRHFVAGAWDRGSSKPEPMPKPGFYMLGGVMHVHPNTWERIKSALPGRPPDYGEAVSLPRPRVRRLARDRILELLRRCSPQSLGEVQILCLVPGLNRRCLYRALDRLEVDGLITVDRAPGLAAYSARPSTTNGGRP